MSELIYGKWPVKEALESGPVSKILVAKGAQKNGLTEILSLAKEKKVPFLWVDKRKLDQTVRGNHQGIVAYVAPIEFQSLDDVFEKALQSKSSVPGVLFLDGIQDPQNLGSILRSAVFFGVSGVVLPKWRAATVTGAVVRASAGAARLIPIAQTSNLTTALQKARKKGIWLVGADMNGDNVKKADIPRPFGLVLGSEGEGLHRLVKENCDFLVSLGGLSSRAGIDSLNVSVACGSLLHHFSS